MSAHREGQLHAITYAAAGADDEQLARIRIYAESVAGEPWKRHAWIELDATQRQRAIAILTTYAEHAARTTSAALPEHARLVSAALAYLESTAAHHLFAEPEPLQLRLGLEDEVGDESP